MNRIRMTVIFLAIPATFTLAANQWAPCVASAQTEPSRLVDVSEQTLEPSTAGRILGNRLLLTGTLLGLLLGQLSVLFGYLKIDHATRGFYSGRLQSAAVIASIATFGFAYLFYSMWKH